MSASDQPSDDRADGANGVSSTRRWLILCRSHRISDVRRSSFSRFFATPIDGRRNGAVVQRLDDWLER